MEKINFLTEISTVSPIWKLKYLESFLNNDQIFGKNQGKVEMVDIKQRKKSKFDQITRKKGTRSSIRIPIKILKIGNEM